MKRKLSNSNIFKTVTASILVTVLAFSAVACSQTTETSRRRRDRDEDRDERETIETSDSLGEPTETEVSVTETVETEETEPQETLPSAELDRNDTIQFFPEWAENRAGVRVSSVAVCSGGVIAGANTHEDFRGNEQMYVEQMILHPNAIPIFVFNDINCSELIGAYMRDEAIDEDTGEFYYMRLDGIIFPDATNLAVFEGWQDLLCEIRNYHLFIDSDFVLDENGEIHGFIYVTNRISEYSTNFAYGNEIDIANLVQLNEWVLAMGLAEPDANYQGEYAEIYSQYPELPDDFAGYPIGLDLSWNEACIGHEYQPGFDYTPYMWIDSYL